MICDDFNEILYYNEKVRGVPREERQMEEFQMVLDDTSYSSPCFTLERGNLSKTNIRKRFDKGVANSDWVIFFLNFSLRHLPYSFFLIIVICLFKQDRKTRGELGNSSLCDLVGFERLV